MRGFEPSAAPAAEHPGRSAPPFKFSPAHTSDSVTAGFPSADSLPGFIPFQVSLNTFRPKRNSC